MDTSSASKCSMPASGSATTPSPMSPWNGSRSAFRRATLSYITLHPHPPFRFDLTLRYLSRSPLEVLDVVDREAAVYRRALWIGGRPRLLEVRGNGGPKRPKPRIML